MSDPLSFEYTMELAEPSARVSRWYAALWGAFIGDAISMPVHWYYNRSLIERDYGKIENYEFPVLPHPESIMHKVSYVVTNEKDNILHEQVKFWGKAGIHYHQFLEAGENTLNLYLMRELMESLIVCKGYNREDYIKRYTAFMLTPETHADTYIEECHRTFFKNYGKGVDPLECGAEDINIGGLTMIIPIILFYCEDPDSAKKYVREHLEITHKGETMARAGEMLTELLIVLLRGADLGEVLMDHFTRDNHPVFGYPFRKLIEKEDTEVVGKDFHTSCPIDEALPSVIYLALKHRRSFESGILSNANLGGDNCHRGAVLGAILGAGLGCEEIPSHLVSSLQDVEDYESAINRLFEASGFSPK